MFHQCHYVILLANYVDHRRNLYIIHTRLQGYQMNSYYILYM